MGSKMPGLVSLSYFLGVPFLLVLLGAALLHWRQTPARNKIPRAQKRREKALQQMEALAQRLRQQEPDLDPKPILELPLLTLAQKLQDEELSLESVLCSYLEQGHDSTCGLAQFLEKPAAKDGIIVQILKAQGAIPFVKTNVAQTLFSFDCSNPIYGQTLNPLNLQKTSGGSSGGEGALLAGRGSILGFGTDTGGSIRIPASFCGICGLKPTGFRLSYSGIASAVKGKKSVTTMAGPMALDVESLVLSLKVLLSEDMHQLDPTVPPIPFREEVYFSKRLLRIGYYESDGFTQPSPSMVRAVRLTTGLLQDAGHEVIPFSIPQIEYAMQHLYKGGLNADGGATLLEKLEGDLVDPCMKGTVTLLRLPDLLKCLLARILKHTNPRLSKTLEELRGVGTPKKLWEQHSKVEKYQHEFIAKWRSLDLDVLLAPALDPAFYISYPAKASESMSYMGLYNLLNFPVGVLPVTRVTVEDEKELAFYKGYYGDTFDKNFQEAVRGSTGLPVAVQCIALPWEEELCLRFMKEVETLTKNQKEPKE
ncbi:fatty-acid amide hydrolase 1 isoform X2 [Erinaceus europaeus]|uniref:fatty acid amide hydrolase n=1 Tax=Erinaceus europaeus TaxID=9365 RepID=A0ABM3YLK1_ERIEU|nr:fatty-acid amide hydrolase 1 isoform X2 [Erinaceus europaeus]